MAMLAEPRRKQKWSVDPRNSTWSKDESKFGQKMLEKMGWSKGKGLGAQEQGSTEHIKVQLKNNHLGLGASNNHEDNWIAHQDDYNQLLAELNDCHGTADSESPSNDSKKSFSLEEKSKSSKKRVHYMKFAKGKDLSSRSDTDLACIFGKREKTKKSSQGEDDDDSEESEEKAKEVPSPPGEVELGNTVTSSLSVTEYFAKRMAELKKSRSQQAKDTQQNAEVTPADSTDLSSEEPKKKLKKKKHNADASNEPQSLENGVRDDSVHKKKKSKNKKEDEIAVCDITDHKEEQEEEVEEQSQGEKLKKKKKKSKRNRELLDLEEKEDNSSPNEDTASEPKKKKKKKKQKQDD